MLETTRSTSSNPDFLRLVRELDAYLSVIDGKEHAFYNQFNASSLIKNCIVVYHNEAAVGCGGFKQFNHTDFEIKRMFVPNSHRGKGIATLVLKELEKWAKELGAVNCYLETGKRMPDAQALYVKNGYLPIPNYGPYVDVENSVCFKKHL